MACTKLAHFLTGVFGQNGMGRSVQMLNCGMVILFNNVVQEDGTVTMLHLKCVCVKFYIEQKDRKLVQLNIGSNLHQ